MINFVFLLLYIRRHRFTLYSLYSFCSLAILSALTAFPLLPLYALSLLALSTLSLSLLSLCLLSLFFCFFLYILSPLFSTLNPFSALSFSVSILYNWTLSLLVERSKVCNVHKLMKTTFVPRQAGHTNVYSNRSHIDPHGRHNQQADNVKNLIKVKFKHQFNFDSCSNQAQIVHWLLILSSFVIEYMISLLNELLLC